MPKFSGKKNVKVYTARGTWTCACGRTFRKAKKCLQCGDKLPRWVAAGKITMDQRNRMTTEQYEDWIVNLAVQDAMKDIVQWGV